MTTDKEHKTELVNFGDLKPGDQLLGADGEPVTVTDVYEKHYPESMYEIEMEDGEVVQASGNHMWYCETEIDFKNREEYKKLAIEFFENYEIPDKLEEDEYFSTLDIVKIFGTEVNTVLFIELASRSLGYSSYTPHLIYSDKMKVSDKREAILNYSYNDFIDFLHTMKAAVINGEGYFYYGEVRTTEEIADLIAKGAQVNIPHKKDVM